MHRRNRQTTVSHVCSIAKEIRNFSAPAALHTLYYVVIDHTAVSANHRGNFGCTHHRHSAVRFRQYRTGYRRMLFGRSRVNQFIANCKLKFIKHFGVINIKTIRQIRHNIIFINCHRAEITRGQIRIVIRDIVVKSLRNRAHLRGRINILQLSCALSRFFVQHRSNHGNQPQHSQSLYHHAAAFGIYFPTVFHELSPQMLYIAHINQTNFVFFNTANRPKIRIFHHC